MLRTNSDVRRVVRLGKSMIDSHPRSQHGFCLGNFTRLGAMDSELPGDGFFFRDGYAGVGGRRRRQICFMHEHAGLVDLRSLGR